MIIYAAIPSLLTGVIQLLSKCSESGLRGGNSTPFSRSSCLILLMSSNFSLEINQTRIPITYDVNKCSPCKTQVCRPKLIYNEQKYVHYEVDGMSII